MRQLGVDIRRHSGIEEVTLVLNNDGMFDMTARMTFANTRPDTIKNIVKAIAKELNAVIMHESNIHMG